ncbi:MAG: PadR family transcriptional regulator [Bdellovibrionota bacterium]
MGTLDKELIKGSTMTVVLTVLDRKEMYGYELIKEIERESKGTFSLKEGTLYPVLHHLEQEGAIESRWGESQTGRKRRYYRITENGRKVLARKRQEWVNFRQTIDLLLGSRVAL